MTPPEGRSLNDRDRYRVINAFYTSWKAISSGERRPSFNQLYSRAGILRSDEDDKVVGKLNKLVE